MGGREESAVEVVWKEEVEEEEEEEEADGWEGRREEEVEGVVRVLIPIEPREKERVEVESVYRKEERV